MKDIEKIISRIDKLKPVSRVANKILEFIEDSEGSASDLSEIIIYDQAVTANLLKICNSAYYGLSRQVDSVQRAVVFLGINKVVDIVIMAGCAENLRTSQKGYDLCEGELWKNSVSSALMARDLAEKKKLTNVHMIFTAALLKDIGKLVLSQYVADSFERINRLVTDQGYSFKEAEQEVIGIDHAQLGAMVLEKWKFSQKMVDIVRNHHLSEELLTPDSETGLVYLADTLCMMMGIGVGSDGLAYRFHQKVIEDLCFSEKDLHAIISGFGDKLRQIEDLVGF